MNNRDKLILDSLSTFRVLHRDHIAQLHFANVKHPVTQANAVLKRLRRDGHVTCATDRRMYMYLLNPPQIKKDSSKLQHYLAMCDFYLECKKYDSPKRFTIEPKIGDKGTIEPDMFMIWQNAPFFVELQRSHYSDKVMQAKLSRYEEYFHSEEWHSLEWQPKDRAPIFPRVWIVSDHKYNAITPFKVVQTKSVEEFIGMIKK
jgi:hypothetical protein